MYARAVRGAKWLGCCGALAIAVAAFADQPLKQKRDHGVSVHSKATTAIEIGDRSQPDAAAGRRCDANDDCRPFQYCATAAGDCDHDGTCVRRPNICPDIYQPVCGCDGNTYGNRCEAAAAGVNVATDGLCAPTCCAPADEPGQGDIPACIEGASCCADGSWACNDSGGTPTCDPGAVCGEVCGGFAGIPCSDPDDFCKLNEGECCCDFQGVCTPTPEVCIEIYAPVCGCDGKTYDNDCFADAAGVSVDHAGPCGGGGEVCGGIQGLQCSDPGQFCKLNQGECCCDFQGVCTDIPDACTLIYDPVCGCDGVTYGNECMAYAAGVSVDHDGVCSEACQTNADCAVIGQLFGEFCQKAAGDCNGTGACTAVPQACLDVYRPVCGCDSQTYSNDCYAHSAGVNVAREGACNNESQ